RATLDDLGRVFHLIEQAQIASPSRAAPAATRMRSTAGSAPSTPTYGLGAVVEQSVRPCDVIHRIVSRRVRCIKAFVRGLSPEKLGLHPMGGGSSVRIRVIARVGGPALEAASADLFPHSSDSPASSLPIPACVNLTPSSVATLCHFSSLQFGACCAMR